MTLLTRRHIVAFAAAAATLSPGLALAQAKLKVAAGTESGTVLRIKGKGVTALQGYGAGDPHVRLRIEVPDRLDRDQKEWLRHLAESARDEQYPGLRDVRRQADEFYAHKAAMKKDG